MSLQDIDTTFQFGEDPPWDEQDRSKTKETGLNDTTFINHIAGHLDPGQKVICKICGKSASEICKEEYNFEDEIEAGYKELEDRLIFDSWTCRFCGGTFADRNLAIKHALDCDDNEDAHSCATCASYEIGEDSRNGYSHICKGNKDRIDTWMKHCPEWIGA